MKTIDRKTTPELADLPEIDLPLHQRRLKAVLMSSWQPERSRRSWSWKSLTNYFTMSKKHLAYGSLSLAMALIAVFGGIVYHNGTPQAKAQDLVKNAITVVSSMSKTDLDKLMKDQDFDLMASLKEAKQAKDLTTLTPEQFAKENNGPDGSGWGPGEFKYLKYTDANGNRVYLGLDDKNIPHFKNMLMKDGTRKAYGEAQIVPADGNTDLPIINADNLKMVVPVGEGAQMITGSSLQE